MIKHTFLKSFPVFEAEEKGVEDKARVQDEDDVIVQDAVRPCD